MLLIKRNDVIAKSTNIYLRCRPSMTMEEKQHRLHVGDLSYHYVIMEHETVDETRERSEMRRPGELRKALENRREVGRSIIDHT